MRQPTPPDGIQRLRPFRSRHLGDARTIEICLPPEYHENSWARYPVVYMLDGQNVFDPQTAFIRGKTWKADRTTRGLIANRQVRPCILVGIWNGGSQRMDEYTGSADPKYGGGHSDRHDRYLIEELMPWISNRFRIDRTPANTVLAGASLGGLYSLEFAHRHPAIVGAVGVLSPSLWWDNRKLIRNLRTAGLTRGCRVWLDIGTSEGASAVENVRELSTVLSSAGFREGADLRTVVEDGAGHNEDAWAGRWGKCLSHLLPR
jgi:predicted alpha/beta superfamily hydrolase